MAITERTYNAICNRLRKYMEAELPHLDGDEIGWYGDVDSIDSTGKYSWRAHDPSTDTSYLLTCNWKGNKKVTHETFSGDYWKKKW